MSRRAVRGLRTVGRIAVVEDHGILSEAIRMVLEGDGHRVHVVQPATASAAVDLAATARPEVVLLDLYLEHGKSSGVIPELRGLGAAVLVLTACDDAVMLGECLELGAAAVLSKTDGFEPLVSAVDLALHGFVAMPPSERDAVIAASRAAREAERARVEAFGQLTARERMVLSHLLEGHQAGDIAAAEFVSLTTVRTHIRGLLAKLGVSSQIGAVALARQAGWPLSA